MSLTFEPVSHTYTYGGVVVPSVTQVLAPLYDFSMIKPGALEVARQKGVATHKMIELDIAGELDDDGLPEWLIPALLQWRRFVKESGFIALASECKVFHPTYRYAGTFDLYGSMKGGHAIIDVKRSFAAGPTIGLQLAAYQEAYSVESIHSKRAKRYALKLSETGPYRLEEFEDKSDLGTFLAMLTIHNWKRKNLK